MRKSSYQITYDKALIIINHQNQTYHKKVWNKKENILSENVQSFNTILINQPKGLKLFSSVTISLLYLASNAFHRHMLVLRSCDW